MRLRNVDILPQLYTVSQHRRSRHVKSVLLRLMPVKSTNHDKFLLQKPQRFNFFDVA